MLFKNSHACVFAALTLFISCAAACVYFLTVHSGSSEGDKTTGKLGAVTAQVTRQHRDGVQKDIFFSLNGQRLHMLLKAKASDLVLKQEKGGVRAVEEMSNVQYYVQEHLFFNQGKPYSQILKLESRHADHFYHEGLFIADDVEISRFLLEGHELTIPISPIRQLMSGSAGFVKISLFEEEPHFHAKECLWTLYGEDEGKTISIRALNADYTPLKMDLSGDVEAQFNGDARLTCDLAVLSQIGGPINDQPQKSFEGYFYSDDPSSFVHYADSEIKIKSRTLNVDVLKPAQAKGKPVQKMQAEKDVCVDYHGNMLTSDHMVYQSTNDAGQKKNKTGYITMTSDNDLVSIRNNLGESIASSKIVIDTIKETITLKAPVRIDRLDYQLTNEAQVKLFLNQKYLDAASSEGTSTLIYNHPKTEESYRFTCYGPVEFNHLKMETSLFSPQDTSGVTLHNRQVHFTHQNKEIFADYVQLLNGDQKTHSKITKIILLGNIRMITLVAEVSEKPLYQYILADKIEIFPDTQEMLLKAKKGNRVLFLDQVNVLEISAPALKITGGQNNETIKSAEGIGDVRFRLMEQELNQLRHRFSLDIPQTKV